MIKTKPTVVIVAAGKNSRFFPLNTRTHKGFLQLVGQPIIFRAFKSLKKHGLQKVVVVVADRDFGGKGLSQYLEKNNCGLDIKLVLQKEAKGMGDALLQAREFINDYFVLASPYYLDLGEIADELINKQQITHASCVLSGTLTKNPELFGILQIDENNHERVLGVREKPKNFSQSPAYKVNSAYLLNQGFITHLANTPENENSLETALTTYAKQTNITWIKNNQTTYSLKYPWHLFQILQKIMSEESTFIHESANLAKTAIIDDSQGPVVIGDGAKIGDFVKIVGPCFIGKNCLVGDYSFIRGSSVENDATIGAKTEVVRSIIFEKTSLHFGYIADSIIGHSNRIGAGLITANKRFDRDNNIRVLVKEKLVESKLNRLGIITGEKAQLGIGVRTMPGVLIGANTTIYPSLTINRNIGHNEIKK